MSKPSATDSREALSRSPASVTVQPSVHRVLERLEVPQLPLLVPVPGPAAAAAPIQPPEPAALKVPAMSTVWELTSVPAPAETTPKLPAS